ncbi:MAG: glycosyltransferase [Anaerolineales bacterium]|nr:glycosyltransferase [Anaerolineales bacterium]
MIIIFLLVGGGTPKACAKETPNLTLLGSLTDLRVLAPIYVASDLFVFPGAVGLGAVQAMCYHLPILTVDSPLHGPEIEYRAGQNAIKLPVSATAEEYAFTIKTLFDSPDGLRALQSGIWPSISHLTVEQMAHKFIYGVNALLV